MRLRTFGLMLCSRRPWGAHSNSSFPPCFAHISPFPSPRAQHGEKTASRGAETRLVSTLSTPGVVLSCQHSHSLYSFWTVWWQSQPTHPPRDVSPFLLTESLFQKTRRRQPSGTSASEGQRQCLPTPFSFPLAPPEGLRVHPRWGLLWPSCKTDGAAPFSVTATSQGSGSSSQNSNRPAAAHTAVEDTRHSTTCCVILQISRCPSRRSFSQSSSPNEG
ncbi:hypothetical protein HDK77DRAFT_250804 [Phyllosticta capitalensis]|uniref:Secreted protein n=1 Tax=Phyllosticta capitalensis TaxID=121624 RepID=A0ABR1YM84_9PEZI